MRRRKTKWKITCITVVIVLLIATSIEFGITQNVTEQEQNISLPENITACEYVAELNGSQSENITNESAPVNMIHIPENNTNNTTNTTGICLNCTINESTERIGYSFNDTDNITIENTTEYKTNVPELVNITPKLSAEKDCFSLAEDPVFTFEYKTQI